MELLTTINDLIWNPMAVLALAVGLLFTVLTKVIQIRRLPEALRLLRGKSSASGLSSFQALSLALSSRVGVGNIAGVATAIAAGGPGALFWMAVCATLGAASAFAESTLAQIFKRRVDGEDRGGIPYYIEHGLRQRWLACVVAGMVLVGYGFVFPGVQSNNIASALEGATGAPTWVTGLAVVALMALVIFGGTRRIAHFAQTVVPFMAVGYVLLAVVILLLNADRIPAMVALVLSSAFGTHATFGGILGAAVSWGVRRAVFSNVAGVGEGTYAAAAADVSHPVKQGLVQSFSIYIDTLFVCMATGLMILVTDAYNVLPEGAGTPLVEHLPGTEAGPAFTQAAVNSTVPGAGGVFVAVALTFFAFTTLVAFYYIAKTNLVYLTGRAATPALDVVLGLGMLGITYYGAVESADLVWAIGDIGYGAIGWVNMICLLFLVRPVARALADYEAQRRDGLDPVFDPRRAGITGADHWLTHGPASAEGSREGASRRGER
ncbi:alanine/glycine:cation symporter family protein [Georgenia alba]|uniref:Alanine/glycine:cation symporter family protein n=1 Tax=Georgenia alba TaxID=2233858 RepID=A0ABW2Q3K8_9MICO